MADYGITKDGFILKTLPEIKSDIEQSLIDAFGEIDLSSDGPFGQIIGVFSKASAEVWESLENVYYSEYPSSAEGVALDNVLSLNGLARLPATRATTFAQMGGTDGIEIPSGSEISDGETKFSLDNSTYISSDTAYFTRITINSATVGSTYSVNIDGTVSSYTAQSGDGIAEITLGLKGAIEADNPNLVISSSTDYIEITAEDYTSPFDIEVTAGDMNISLLSSIGSFTALLTGKVNIPTGTLIQIDTPITGWDTVKNVVGATGGSDIETDVEARIRRSGSLQKVGASVLDSIRARLLNDIDGVTSVFAFENRTDNTVDGRPPHSFEMVIEGGDEQEIADLLWKTKPAGIQTVGTETGWKAEDSNGDLQEMLFSRPTPKFVHLDVVLTLYSEEEFPSDGNQRVIDALMSYGESLQLGKDLIIQRWLTPIFSVPGIASAVVKQAVTDTNPGTPPPITWSTTNLSIGSTAIAKMVENLISVA